ncbi:MAG: cyclic nucleotide-binding protein [Moraxellaceae bacterium]|jgi:CRP-like cAMP-binding protein|nr:cyclic nucleotide-binding protein [Moraxellaceae bacterium]
MNEHLADHLSLIPMFSTLTAEELQGIEKYLFFKSVDQGGFVFREGERGDYLCFVALGTLEVIKHNHEGQPVVISRLAKGHSIGEMALLDRLTRSASVRASTPSRLIVLTRESFDAVLDQHPVVGIKILKGIAHVLSTNLRKTSDRLAEFMPSLA